MDYKSFLKYLNGRTKENKETCANMYKVLKRLEENKVGINLYHIVTETHFKRLINVYDEKELLDAFYILLSKEVLLKYETFGKDKKPLVGYHMSELTRRFLVDTIKDEEKGSSEEEGLLITHPDVSWPLVAFLRRKLLNKFRKKKFKRAILEWMTSQCEQECKKFESETDLSIKKDFRKLLIDEGYIITPPGSKIFFKWDTRNVETLKNKASQGVVKKVSILSKIDPEKADWFIYNPEIADKLLAKGGILRKAFSAMHKHDSKKAREWVNKFKKDKENRDFIEEYEETFGEPFDKIFKKLKNEKLLIESRFARGTKLYLSIDFTKYSKEKLKENG